MVGTNYWSKTFSPLELTQGTLGMATKRVLQNWHARDQWLTPTKTPQPGKSYSYTFAHLLEAMIVTELARLGFTSERARDVILNRLKAIASDKTSHNRRFDKMNISELPDFQREGQCWAIALPMAKPGGGKTGLHTIAVEPDEIHKLLRELPSFALIDIAGIVDRANRFAETHGTESLEDTPVGRKRRPP